MGRTVIARCNCREEEVEKAAAATASASAATTSVLGDDVHDIIVRTGLPAAGYAAQRALGRGVILALRAVAMGVSLERVSLVQRLFWCLLLRLLQTDRYEWITDTALRDPL